MPCPKATDTHYPIPHHELYSMVREVMPEFGLDVVEAQHGTDKFGSRYFGLMKLHSSVTDWSPVLGLRNSHDKSLSAGLVLGIDVTVCDNLSFYGDMMRFDRKHTRHIERDLTGKIMETLLKTTEEKKRMEKRVEIYQGTKMPDRKAHHFIIRALDVGAVLAGKVPTVLEEWRKPRYEAFEARTAWSLFNAFTESMKGAGQISTHVGRSGRLHRVFDEELNVDQLLGEISLAE
jgi:hypothetical protein